MGDRTQFVPSHGSYDDNVLPANPLFTRLLTLAHRAERRPAIRDVHAGIEKDVAELLSDALNLRRVLKSHLTPDTIQDLHDGNEVYISVTAPGGYEFAVAILAVLALGAAASPFSTVQPVEEAKYYVTKARSVAVLAATQALELGKAVEKEIQSTTDKHFVCVPINSYATFPPVPTSEILISSNQYVDPNGPGIVIFTSGTTGPPKGAILRRAAITDGAMCFAEQLGLQHTDTLLHLLPVHHATGIWVSFFPFLQSGACIEFRPGNFSPQWTWDRFKRGGLTHFSGVPTIYMRMMRHYQEHLNKLPSSALSAYRSGAAQIRTCICGTSALPKPIDDFWTQLRNGQRIVQRYGSTETGVVFNMPFSANTAIPDGSVGTATLGVDVKLAGSSDEGEVLMRSFNMFSKYLHDPIATKNAHTPEGYFKTGDIARKEGDYYFIIGRASVDIIKSGGYKISALDIEREILALPYAGEAMVVGVPDDEFGQRVAAVVSLRNDEVAQEFYREHGRSAASLRLEELRADVRTRLAGYKMPTLLRVVQGELPKSATGKVVKKTLGPKYFPEDYVNDAEVQVWRNDRARDTKL